MSYSSSFSSSLWTCLVLASCVRHGLAQVPATAPECVQLCARLKVSEGYCTSSALFVSTYTQCLKDNCDQANAAVGNGFANSICQTSTAPVNGTSPIPAGVLPPMGNSTGNMSSNYAATLANELRAAGLGTFATLISSPEAAPALAQLEQANHTVFGPSDTALAALNLNSTPPADAVALISYHILPGTLDISKIPTTGHAIVRTSLGGAPFVHLPANDREVMVLAHQPNGSLIIVEPMRNVTVSNFTSVGNLQLGVIESVLMVPGTIGATADELPELSNLVRAINASAPQLFDQLDQTPGLTIFAPINSGLANMTRESNLEGILLNHIVNASVLYSTVLVNVSSTKSAGGASLSFMTNTTGTFVHSGDKTVKIVQTDITTRNGVIHLVDGVLGASNSTPTFPIPNSDNATETSGITPVIGDTSGMGARATAQSGTWRIAPHLFGVAWALSIPILCHWV